MWYLILFVVGFGLGNLSRTAWAHRALGRAWRWVLHRTGE